MIMVRGDQCPMMRTLPVTIATRIPNHKVRRRGLSCRTRRRKVSLEAGTSEQPSRAGESTPPLSRCLPVITAIASLTVTCMAQRADDIEL